MAGIKISDLPPVVAPALSDVFPIDQGAVTYKESAQQLLSLFQSNGTALTRINDTNVTMTLGGSPSISLLNAASMTLGWTGQLSVPRGGTGNSTFTAFSVICAGTTATGAFQNVVGLGNAGEQLTSNGAGALPTWQSGTVSPLTTKGDLYTYTTTNARLAVGVTNGQILQVNSGASTGLAWSTATYPATATNVARILRSDATNWVESTSTFADTYTASSFLYANGANNVAGLATANNGVPVTSNTGVPSILAGPGTTGNFLQSNAAAAPSWSTATFPSSGGAAGNILISNGTNYIASTSLWPNTVGTAGKILRSDGTSNAYTTSTFADTYGASELLYSNGANTVAGLTVGIDSVLISSHTGVPSWLANPAATGRYLQSNSGAPSTWSSFVPAASGANSDITSMTGLTGTLQAPTGVKSSAGLDLMAFVYTASAVNGFQFLNNTTGSDPAISAIGSDTNIDLQLNGKGTGGVNIVGVSTNSNATAGHVGENISANVSEGAPVSATTATALNVTSISLTAGDWDVTGNVWFEFSNQVGNGLYAASNTTSATLPAGPENWTAQYMAAATAFQVSKVIPTVRYSLNATTTVYLVAQCLFAAGTGSVSGNIKARRVR